MKHHAGTPPDAFGLVWAGRILAFVALLGAAALLSVMAYGQPVPAQPFLTPDALAALQPAVPPLGGLVGGVWRNPDGTATVFFPPEAGQVVLLGTWKVQPANLSYLRDGMGWPFLTDPRIDALPVYPTRFGSWRLPEWPRWAVPAGETVIPLTGPAALQPAFILDGRCWIGQPLLLP